MATSTRLQTDPKLPLELFDKIASYIDHDIYDAHSSLRTWSLVCKAFVFPTQQRLFGHIQLVNGQCEPPEDNRYATGSTIAFCTVLRSSPHLAQHVQDLSQLIEANYVRDEPISIGHLLDASAFIFTSLVNLRHLHLYSDSALYRIFSGMSMCRSVNVLDLLRETGARSKLRAVDLNGPGKLPSGLLWLKWMPSLRFLRIDNPQILQSILPPETGLLPHEILNPPSPAPEITSLAVYPGTMTVSSITPLLAFIANGQMGAFSLQKLRDLRVVVTGDLQRAAGAHNIAVLNGMLQQSPNLVSLLVAPPFQIAYPSMSPPLPVVPPIDLSSLPSLKCFSMTGVAYTLDRSHHFRANPLPWIIETLRTIASLAETRACILYVSSFAEKNLEGAADVVKADSLWSTLDDVVDEKGFDAFHLTFKFDGQSNRQESGDVSLDGLRQSLSERMPKTARKGLLSVANMPFVTRQSSA